jgi:hypothetical protein
MLHATTAAQNCPIVYRWNQPKEVVFPIEGIDHLNASQRLERALTAEWQTLSRLVNLADIEMRDAGRILPEMVSAGKVERLKPIDKKNGPVFFRLSVLG